MPQTNADAFKQDEDGRCWYTFGDSQRTRAWEKTCETCGETFFASAAHPKQKTCGNECASLLRTKGRNADSSFVGVITSEKFQQDESGQWWHYTKHQRSRAKVLTCPVCKSDYLVPAGDYKQRRFCSGKCRRGVFSARYKGGRKKNLAGYVLIFKPDHPDCQGNTRTYVLEHRLVMEEKLGRYLERHERVHHINGVRDDNRPENLELWASGHPAGQRAEDPPHCPTCTCGL